MSRRSTYSGPTLAQFDADIQASVSAPDSLAATLSRTARSSDPPVTSKLFRAGYARTPQKSPARGVSRAHTRNTLLDEISTWLPRNFFTLGLGLAVGYILTSYFRPDATFDPSVPFFLAFWGFALWVLGGFFRYLFATLRAEAVVEAETAIISPPRYNPYIPISPFAIGILKLLSTAGALYLALLVLLNIEILMLFPLVLKQRGYSWLYKELGTPVVGPVFMTQIRESVFFALDGIFTPWSLAMAAIGTNFDGVFG